MDATTGATQPGHSTREGVLARRHLLVLADTSSWIFALPPEGVVIVGRSRSCQVRLDTSGVSRMHARISITSGAVTITDLGSQGGTLVNGTQIASEHLLAPADVITIDRATLILHETAREVSPRIVIPEVFQRRVDEEVDRSLRRGCATSVVVLAWGAPPSARVRQELERELRIDAASWLDERTLAILIGDAEAEAAHDIVDRLRARIDGSDRSSRLAIATCPDDGSTAQQLVAAARAAVAVDRLPRRTFQVRALGAHQIIVASPVTARLYALVDRLASSDLPVLVLGETGVGKELVAAALHQQSPRRDRKMISLNCAALQDPLVENELFGHARGAYSGAITDKAGLLEVAHGSTVFLDEIADLSPAAQAKLLRVIDTGRVTRLGEVGEREIDARIVAATHRDLEQAVATGRFRQDLYFRLSGATLHLPPLRERVCEIPLLAAMFLEAACEKAGRSAMEIEPEAMAALCAYSWPGNVRELRHLMHYLAAAHVGQTISPASVLERLQAKPTSVASSAPDPHPPALGFRPLADELRDLERARIAAALEAAGGRQNRAAELLSMPVRTLHEKLKLYRLGKYRERSSS
jgi:two-component system, NtrC family, response regulator AtoC